MHVFHPPPAQDICKDPQLFYGGANRFDVKQGMLGDCWLVSAIASITQDSLLLKKVYKYIHCSSVLYAACIVHA